MLRIKRVCLFRTNLRLFRRNNHELLRIKRVCLFRINRALPQIQSQAAVRRICSVEIDSSSVEKSTSSVKRLNCCARIRLRGYWVLATARMLGYWLCSREFRPGCWIGCLFRVIFVVNRMFFCQGCGTQVVEHGKYCHDSLARVLASLIVLHVQVYR